MRIARECVPFRRVLACMMHAGERLGAMKKLLITYCGLETLCRVCEKINVLAEEEIEEW